MSTAADLGGVRTYNDALTAKELRRILKVCAASELQPAKVDYAPEITRSGKVAWLKDPWLSGLMAEIAGTINEAHYHFDLEGLKEPLQCAYYGIGDHFGWHETPAREPTRQASGARPR